MKFYYFILFLSFILTGCISGITSPSSSGGVSESGILIDNFDDQNNISNYPWGGWFVAISGSNTVNYRLYIYVFDGKNHAGTANIPFKVQ